MVVSLLLEADRQRFDLRQADHRRLQALLEVTDSLFAQLDRILKLVHGGVRLGLGDLEYALKNTGHDWFSCGRDLLAEVREKLSAVLAESQREGSDRAFEFVET